MEQYGLQAFVGVLAAFILQWLKRQSWFPFLNTWSAKWWKVTVSALVAAASAVGITYSYDPTIGRLVVDGLTWASVWNGLLAFGVSFLSQHLAYEGVARKVLPTKAIGLLLAVSLAASSAAGCAATTARARAQTTAMVSTELALAVDQAEWDVYEAGVYDQATHQEIGRYIRALLYAERGYVRAVQAWPEGDPFSTPASVQQARHALVTAAADLRRGLQGVPGTGPIVKTLETFEAAWGLTPSPPDPVTAEAGWIGLLLLLLKMVADGRLTREKILFWLKQDGATDDELAAAEQQLTDAIDKRDQDLGR